MEDGGVTQWLDSTSTQLVTLGVDDSHSFLLYKLCGI
jgi:hypothetical protein